jgi:hypothetical protein
MMSSGSALRAGAGEINRGRQVAWQRSTEALAPNPNEPERGKGTPDEPERSAEPNKPERGERQRECDRAGDPK